MFVFPRSRGITLGRLAVLLAFSLALLSGCTAVHVYQVDPAGSMTPGLQNSPATEWESKTLVVYLWGLVRQDLPVENCVLGDGTRINIEEIKVDTNFGQGLLSIVTLGLVRPATYSWRCAKPCRPTGVLD